MAKAKTTSKAPAKKTGSKGTAKAKAKKPTKKVAKTTVQKATAAATRATKAVKRTAKKTVKQATKVVAKAKKVVTRAANTVAKAAKERVVEPVEKALGVGEKPGREPQAPPAAGTAESPSPLAAAAAHRAEPHPVTAGSLAAKILTRTVAAAAEIVDESGIGHEQHRTPAPPPRPGPNAL